MWIPFLAWQLLCKGNDGSANKDINAIQLWFFLDTLKLTSKTSADQCVQDFTKIKDYYDTLKGGYTA